MSTPPTRCAAVSNISRLGRLSALSPTERNTSGPGSFPRISENNTERFSHVAFPRVRSHFSNFSAIYLSLTFSPFPKIPSITCCKIRCLRKTHFRQNRISESHRLKGLAPFLVILPHFQTSNYTLERFNVVRIEIWASLSARFSFDNFYCGNIATFPQTRFRCRLWAQTPASSSSSCARRSSSR